MLEISSSTSDFLLNRYISLVNSSFPSYMFCLITEHGYLIYISHCIMNIAFLLPLCLFILHHGAREWQKQRCSNSLAGSACHSDCFTYHMVTMELIGVFGCVICLCGLYRDNFYMFYFGFYPVTFNYYGQTFFHVLTCVERYLAVVHPITYLNLRQERGVRIRNVITGFGWLLCFVWMGLVHSEKLNIIIDVGIMTVTLASVSFCSLSVLCALIRPGPGEHGGDRKRVDQSKHRAFYTIVVIMGTLVLRCTWCLITAGNFAFGQNKCVTMAINFWLCLPSSLVLPLLLLHRAGKLKRCKNNAG